MKNPTEFSELEHLKDTARQAILKNELKQTITQEKTFKNTSNISELIWCVKGKSMCSLTNNYRFAVAWRYGAVDGAIRFGWSKPERCKVVCCQWCRTRACEKKESCIRPEIDIEEKNERRTVRQNKTRDDFFLPLRCYCGQFDQ